MNDTTPLTLEPVPASIKTGIACPCCASSMQEHRFSRKLQGEIELDICYQCQCIWFDEFESLQLAPSGILALFQLIHQHHDEPRNPWPDTLTCPRCRERIIHSFDVCKNGRFAYHRCLQKHGHLITFSGFMMEKGFVRQLNGAEIADLAKKVQTIRCSGCGAPVDIRSEIVCSQCRAPITILDPDAVEKALAELKRTSGRTEYRNPAAFTAALVASERARVPAESSSWSVGDSFDAADLVVGGVELLVGLLSEI